MLAHVHVCWLVLIVAGLSCASNEQPPPASPLLATKAPAPAAAVPQHPQPASAQAAEPANPALAVEQAPVDPFAGTTFPPQNFNPPFERSAKKGDGEWVRLGDSSKAESAALDPPVLYRTTVHPHPVSKWIRVTIAAIDLKHTELHLAAGTDDPRVDQLPDGQAPGLVAEPDREQLVAVFNGGFKPKHGNWGMMVANTELVAPREQGCTVMLGSDGAVNIGSWPKLLGKRGYAMAFRQTPPCLLEAGEVHPDLLAGNTKAWAGRNAKRKTRRRSVIGIDASGRTLFFGVGEEAEPQLLAKAMKHAGAEHAAQLDINWSWTRFLVFGKPNNQLQVTSTLIPQMVHRRRGYVEKTQPRDFFYLKRR